MHTMSISAPTNRRQRKMQETAARLTSVSRRLTVEHGLSGFTIEEVCREVDVSRRTFFNYFPSKEDAVLGVDPDDQLQLFAQEFLARKPGGWDKVLDDLVDLVIEHFESAGIDANGHAEFVAAIEREPRLLIRFIGVTRERDRDGAALIARREGLPADDPQAHAAMNVLSLLMRMAGERFFDAANTDDFAQILHDSLAALRVVLASPSPRKAHQ